MNNILNKADDLHGRVQGVHSGLRNVSDFGTQDGGADLIRIHTGNIYTINDDITHPLIDGATCSEYAVSLSLLLFPWC